MSIAAAVPLITSAINTIGGIMNNTANRQAQENMQNRQNQLSMDLIEDARNYNSPAHQVALLRQAGLNPNLAQGQFEPTSQATPMASPNVMNPNPMALESPDIQGIRESESRQKLNESNKKTIDALRHGQYLGQYVDVLLGASKVKETQQNTAYLAQQVNALEQQVTNMKQEYQNLKAQYDNIVANTKKTQTETQGQAIENKFKPRMIQAQITNYFASAALSNSMVPYWRENARYMGAMVSQVTLGNRFLQDTYSFRVGRERWQTFQVKVQGQKLLFDLNSDKQWRNKERAFQLLNAGFDAGGKFMQSLYDFNPISHNFHDTVNSGSQILGTFSHFNPQ